MPSASCDLSVPNWRPVAIPRYERTWSAERDSDIYVGLSSFTAICVKDDAQLVAAASSTETLDGQFQQLVVLATNFHDAESLQQLESRGNSVLELLRTAARDNLHDKAQFALSIKKLFFDVLRYSRRWKRRAYLAFDDIFDARIAALVAEYGDLGQYTKPQAFYTLIQLLRQARKAFAVHFDNEDFEPIHAALRQLLEHLYTPDTMHALGMFEGLEQRVTLRFYEDMQKRASTLADTDHALESEDGALATDFCILRFATNILAPLHHAGRLILFARQRGQHILQELRLRLLSPEQHTAVFTSDRQAQSQPPFVTANLHPAILLVKYLYEHDMAYAADADPRNHNRGVHRALIIGSSGRLCALCDLQLKQMSLQLALFPRTSVKAPIMWPGSTGYMPEVWTQLDLRLFNHVTRPGEIERIISSAWAQHSSSTGHVQAQAR